MEFVSPEKLMDVSSPFRDSDTAALLHLSVRPKTQINRDLIPVVNPENSPSPSLVFTIAPTRLESLGTLYIFLTRKIKFLSSNLWWVGTTRCQLVKL